MNSQKNLDFGVGRGVKTSASLAPPTTGRLQHNTCAFFHHIFSPINLPPPPSDHPRHSKSLIIPTCTTCYEHKHDNSAIKYLRLGLGVLVVVIVTILAIAHSSWNASSFSSACLSAVSFLSCLSPDRNEQMKNAAIGHWRVMRV